MAQTVKITPASGLLEFIGNNTSNKPYLQHDDNGNLTLTLQATKKFIVSRNLKVNGKVTMAQQTLTDGAAITWDFNSGANATVTLAGARTLVIANMETGDTGLILVKQDAAGGRTLTLPGGSTIVGGGSYTASPAANATDVLGVYYDGTTYWWTIGYNTVTPPLTSVGITGGDFVIANSPLTSNGTIGLALATVNSNVGTFGSATAVPVITVNAKGLVTAVSATNISIPTNLDSLTDVTISSTVNGQLLQFNGSQWVNWTPNYLTGITSGQVTGALGYTPVPNTRNLTINGVTQNLTADRTWTISTVDYVSRVQHGVKAGVAINKGQAVYVTSADGTNMIVGLASNASEMTSSKTMGLLDATVSANGMANVVTEGLLAGLDTSLAGTAGDPVWLGENGNLIYGLPNKPYAPRHLVFIGIVTRKNQNNGEIFVKVQNGFELQEIHNVDLITTVPVSGHILGYDGTLWVNRTIASWLGFTPANDANVVHTSGNETISGIKTFSGTTQATSTSTGTIVTSGGVGIAKNLYVGGNINVVGNLIIGGTTTTVNAQNLSVSDNMIYLNNGIQTTITNAVGNGSTVVYTTEETHNYIAGMSVTITGVSPIAYNLSNQTITAVGTNSFTIANSATGSYSSGGTARAKTNANPDLGFAAGYNDGSYAHAGLFRDATDNTWKFFKGYVPEPDTSPFIDTSHASFAFADLRADNITGRSFIKVGGTSSEFLKADGSVDSNTYLTTGTASSTYQPLDADLTAISGLAATGFLKRTGTNTWTLDSNVYLTAESDTLATVTGRGNSTTNDITIGALTVGGSLSYGTFPNASNYVTGADNILLKGNASGVSGIFFESERNGTNINHPSDFGFIQYHSYGIGGSSGESNRLVIGVSNDADDLLVLNPVNANGLVVRVGAGTIEYTVYHAGNIPTWNQDTTGNAGTVTNGVYTNGSYANPAWITSLAWSKITGAPAFITGYTETDTLDSVISRGDTTARTTRFYQTSGTTIDAVAPSDRGLTILQDSPGRDAYITFHIEGDYAGYFGLGGIENDLVWGGWSLGAVRHRIWHSGNLTNLNQLTNGPGYISAETDTLASVTGRGSTTATSVSFTAAGKTASFGTNSTNPNAVIASQTNYIQIVAAGATQSMGLVFHNAGISTSALEFVNTDANTGYFNFRSDDSNWNVRVNGNTVWHAGNDGAGSGLDADLLDGYHASGSVGANTVVIRDVNGYIYANYINTNVGVDNPSIANFITDNGDGWMRKSSIAHVRNSLGNYGGWLTQAAADPLYVNVTGDSMTGPLVITGSTSGQELFAVNGVNGRLFTVTDDLSNSLFSVNTVAGLPVIEAFANNTVNLGPFSAPIVINASGISTPSHGTSANWHSAYNDVIISAAVSGTTTKTLTLTQRDGGTVTASWTDIDTDTDTNTDAQTLSLSGNTLSISGGNSVTLSSSGISQATADSLYVKLAGGSTVAGTTYFSGSESMQVYGVRGRFTNDYIHLYNKVGVGHPSGWGQGEGNTPVYGLSTYGGLNVAYGYDGGAYLNTYTRINKEWGAGDFNGEQLTIYGTYPSIALRSLNHDSKWLIHNASSLQFYHGGNANDNNWANQFEIRTNGDIWLGYAGDVLSNLLAGKSNTGHTHDDRYYTETESDARFLRGTTSPSSVNNFTISIGNNGTYSYVQSHSGQPLELNPIGNAVRIAGNTVWHAGNDGAGSGLDADLLDGYNSDTVANVNTIVRRDASGNIYSNYVLGTYFNASQGNSENPTIGQIWTQNTSDNYLRKSTPTHFRSQVTDGYYLSLSGGTLSGPLYMNGELAFRDGSGGYSNIIRAAAYPSEGYPAGNDYWIEYSSRGGHHFVLNTDSGVGAAANTMDDFIVWQGAIDGDRLLEVSNTGTLTIADRLIELSSIRYKTQVESLTPALDKVLQLRPVHYVKIGGTGSTEIGLIAEEVAEIYPELIKYNNEGEVDGINYTRIAPILIKTIQEQQELIKNLTKRIDDLENR